MKRRQKPQAAAALTKPPPNCPWCRGTGFSFVRVPSGNVVEYDQHRDGDAVKRCTHGGTSQSRIEYRDSEPRGELL